MERNSVLSSDSPLSIYIHVPFCVSKCAYCDFYSIPCGRREQAAPSRTCADTEDPVSLQKRYVSALCRQMELASKRYSRPTVSTVFIGGGTPSILKTEDMLKITETLYRCFDVQGDAEFTVEANPETVNLKKLKEYRKMGINRISFGMQSALETELKALSRIHTLKSVKEAVKNARIAGFENVNLDIMYALPYQTAESFKTTLDTVVSLSPEHVSVYGLQLEEGTPLFDNKEKLIFPGEDGENEMNALALDVLSKSGYRRYEISNYAKKGFECKHNLCYWTLGEYLGFGTAAHSFKDKKRYGIKKDISAYCISSDFSDVTETEEALTEESAVEEYIMLSMRLCKGLSIERLYAMTAKADIYLKRAEPFIKGGFVELVNSHGEIKSAFLRFTPKGFNVSNTVLSEIIYG